MCVTRGVTCWCLGCRLHGIQPCSRLSCAQASPLFARASWCLSHEEGTSPPLPWKTQVWAVASFETPLWAYLSPPKSQGSKCHLGVARTAEDHLPSVGSCLGSHVLAVVLAPHGESRVTWPLLIGPKHANSRAWLLSGSEASGSPQACPDCKLMEWLQPWLSVLMTRGGY